MKKTYLLIMFSILFTFLTGCSSYDKNFHNAEADSPTSGRIVWAEGLFDVASDPVFSGDLFHILIAVQPSNGWTVDEELVRLIDLGYDVHLDGDRIKGSLYGSQLQNFPVHSNCDYHISLLLQTLSKHSPKLLSSLSEEECLEFVQANEIPIPEELNGVVHVKQLITSIELRPFDICGVSHPPYFDFYEAVRAAVLTHHGVTG